MEMDEATEFDLALSALKTVHERYSRISFANMALALTLFALLFSSDKVGQFMRSEAWLPWAGSAAIIVFAVAFLFLLLQMKRASDSYWDALNAIHYANPKYYSIYRISPLFFITTVAITIVTTFFLVVIGLYVASSSPATSPTSAHGQCISGTPERGRVQRISALPLGDPPAGQTGSDHQKTLNCWEI